MHMRHPEKKRTRMQKYEAKCLHISESESESANNEKSNERQIGTGLKPVRFHCNHDFNGVPFMNVVLVG